MQPMHVIVFLYVLVFLVFSVSSVPCSGF